MADIHALPPAMGRLALGRVGVVGVRKPLVIQRTDRIHTLSAEFEVHVDLPALRKGSDLSRNAQILSELVDETAHRPVHSVEGAAVAVVRELLARHTYAQEAEVCVKAEYFRSRGIREDKASLEDFVLYGRAFARRNGREEVLVRKEVGAEAVGMTACPCAMETCRALLEQEYPLLKDPQFATLPIITHNQRNRSRLTLGLPESLEIEADELLDIIEHAQSSPTYAILKRGDEGRLVLDAHRNPRFVEDVVRALLTLTEAHFPSLPGEVEVDAFTRSEESIHKYDVSAEHRITLGELRRELHP
jgi:GTP cyclohydrolase-4